MYTIYQFYEFVMFLFFGGFGGGIGGTSSKLIGSAAGFLTGILFLSELR
jgi:hypothetical protein